MRHRPRVGAWLVLALTLLVLSGHAMLSQPSYANNPVKLQPKLNQVDEPNLPPANQDGADGLGNASFRGTDVSNSSLWSLAWKIGLLAALAGLGLPMIELLRRELKGQRINWSAVGSFALGAIKGIGKTLLAIGLVVAIGAALVALGVSATVILVAAAIFVAVGAGFSIYHRWKEQQAAGTKPQLWKTVGIGALDALGVSGLVEGLMGKRLLTGESLDPEVAGESFGSGLIQIAALGIGARTLPKGLGRMSAATEQTILSRVRQVFNLAREARRSGRTDVTFASVWQVLKAAERWVRFDRLIARVSDKYRNTVYYLLEKGALEWQDGMLKGLGGSMNPLKLEDALTAGNLRRIKAIFNNIKGGEAQLRAQEFIKQDPNFRRFVAEFRDPSTGGLDAIIEMKDGTFQIVEVKGLDSAVGPNNVHRVLSYKNKEANVDTDLLLVDIEKRLEHQFADLAQLTDAIGRKDGSVTLRIELIGTRATESLEGLNGKLVNGIRLEIQTRP